MIIARASLVKCLLEKQQKVSHSVARAAFCSIWQHNLLLLCFCMGFRSIAGEIEHLQKPLRHVSLAAFQVSSPCPTFVAVLPLFVAPAPISLRIGLLWGLSLLRWYLTLAGPIWAAFLVALVAQWQIFGPLTGQSLFPHLLPLELDIVGVAHGGKKQLFCEESMAF